MTYQIVKIDTKTQKEYDYGNGHSKQDIQEITKGYKFNGLFYERKNSKYIFTVKEEN